MTDLITILSFIGVVVIGSVLLDKFLDWIMPEITTGSYEMWERFNDYD